MQDNNKISIIKVWIVSNKKKIFIISIVIFIIFYYLLNKNRSNSTSIKSTPTPTPVLISTDTNYSYDQNQIPKYKANKKPYLINSFETSGKLTGYGWSDKLIYYSTNNGVYELSNQNPVLNADINRGWFSTDSTKFLYTNNKGIYLYKFKDLINQKIQTKSTVIYPDENLNYIIEKGDQSVSIIDTETNSTITVPLRDSVYNTDWIVKRNKFYIYYSKLNEIEIYDTTGQKQFAYTLDKNDLFLGVSSDINSLITINQNSINIINSNTGNRTKSILKNTDNIKLNWIDENNFIITEREYLSNLGVYDQYFWIFDLKANKTYFTNSIPIISKINDDFKLITNKDKSAILASDNNGSLWVFSLIEDLIPTYSESGIILYKMPDTTKGNNH